jgi:hypothetical protein
VCWTQQGLGRGAWLLLLLLLLLAFLHLTVSGTWSSPKTEWQAASQRQLHVDFTKPNTRQL